MNGKNILERAFEDLQEQLDIIEVKLNALVVLLPQDALDEVKIKVKYIKEAGWERRMGDDL